jgi:hypothetical protein
MPPISAVAGIVCHSSPEERRANHTASVAPSSVPIIRSAPRRIVSPTGPFINTKALNAAQAIISAPIARAIRIASRTEATHSSSSASRRPRLMVAGGGWSILFAAPVAMSAGRRARLQDWASAAASAAQSCTGATGARWPSSSRAAATSA